MKQLQTALLRVFVGLVIVGLLWLVFANYSFVFSQTVEGRIIGVERITQPAAVITSGQMSPEALFSFSVAIEDSETKRVYTASSEDRQWGVAKFCSRVKARFYPYPIWNFEKNGTWHNARVIELFDCKSAAESAADAGAAAAQPPAPTPSGL
jgi:hypothetical protein